MADHHGASPFADDESSTTQLLQGLISPAPAQALVLPPPDTPPPTRPGESTPVTGSLATAPSQATPKIAPKPEPDLGTKISTKIRRGLAGYFSSGAPETQPVGARDTASGRVITQPTASPAINQALATGAMGTYRAGLESAIRKIAGAELAATRQAKNPRRLDQKITLEGQPPQTVSDYGAAQISVDSPQAKDAVVRAVRAKFPILREQDNFAQGDPEYGYRSYKMQVGMPNGASEELQIVPREVLEANGEEHHDYKAARNRRLKAKAQNDAAMEKFNRRNGVVNRIHEARPDGLVKGAAVQLRDGSRGTISYLDPNLKIARVRTEKGKNVTVRRGELKTGVRDQGSGVS